MQYIGRFAPSPTGPLHFGSLVAAVASYCDARAHQGKWLLRMEDIDAPRSVAGAAASIIHTLHTYGFVWDGNILYQSNRGAAYVQALDQLKKQDMIYPCICSRKTISEQAEHTGIEGAIYPRTCLKHSVLHHPIQISKTPAWRFKTTDKVTSFPDVALGLQSQNVAIEIGDFVIKRTDGLFAYQLAVVVDDAKQGITHVVRGEDLLTSTARQILLQQALGFQQPIYQHVPIVTNAEGQKLSKQTRAEALPLDSVNIQLCRAFTFLKLNPPAHLQTASLQDCWLWAFRAWLAK